MVYAYNSELSKFLVDFITFDRPTQKFTKEKKDFKSISVDIDYQETEYNDIQFSEKFQILNFQSLENISNLEKKLIRKKNSLMADSRRKHQSIQNDALQEHTSTEQAISNPNTSTILESYYKTQGKNPLFQFKTKLFNQVKRFTNEFVDNRQKVLLDSYREKATKANREFPKPTGSTAKRKRDLDDGSKNLDSINKDLNYIAVEIGKDIRRFTDGSAKDFLSKELTLKQLNKGIETAKKSTKQTLKSKKSTVSAFSIDSNRLACTMPIHLKTPLEEDQASAVEDSCKQENTENSYSEHFDSQGGKAQEANHENYYGYLPDKAKEIRDMYKRISDLHNLNFNLFKRKKKSNKAKIDNVEFHREYMEFKKSL